jgi:hypothetical protein
MKCSKYILIFLLLSACFEPDEILPKSKIQTTEIRLNTTNNQAAYLCLSELSRSYDSTGSNWHLRFENDANKWGIFLNTLSQVAVYNTKNTNFDSITEYYNLSQADWQFDISTSEGLTPSIGDWGDFSFNNPKSFKNIYLISWPGHLSRLVYKFQLLDAQNGSYHFRYGTLDGSLDKTIWLPKGEQYSFGYFSFESNEIATEVEPRKDRWDICFTFLSDSLAKHEGIPHLPTLEADIGLYQAVLLNERLNQAAIDTVMSLEDTDFFYAKNLPYLEQKEIYELFYTWDDDLKMIEVNPKLIVYLTDGNRYYAIRATNFVQSPDGTFTTELNVKQL